MTFPRYSENRHLLAGGEYVLGKPQLLGQGYQPTVSSDAGRDLSRARGA